MFLAKYNGTCPSCEEQIDIGNEVTLVDGHAGKRVTIHARHLEDGEVVVDSRTGRPDHTTLPRGKTAKDRCGTCFQIPASNGTCGCVE